MAAAIEFIETHDNQEPFFAYVAFTAPHDPRMPPMPFREMYERWKLIVYPRIGHAQLFDLQTDPHEITNLVDRPEHAPPKSLACASSCSSGKHASGMRLKSLIPTSNPVQSI